MAKLSVSIWPYTLDLEKFFDRINHDILMARVARRVQDPGAVPKGAAFFCWRRIGSRCV